MAVRPCVRYEIRVAFYREWQVYVRCSDAIEGERFTNRCASLTGHMLGNNNKPTLLVVALSLTRSIEAILRRFQSHLFRDQDPIILSHYVAVLVSGTGGVSSKINRYKHTDAVECAIVLLHRNVHVPSSTVSQSHSRVTCTNIVAGAWRSCKTLAALTIAKVHLDNLISFQSPPIDKWSFCPTVRKIKNCREQPRVGLLVAYTTSQTSNW